MSERRTVNVLQAVAMTGLSRRTIYYQIKSGKIECAPKLAASDSVQIYVDSLPVDLTRKPERCIIPGDEARL